MIPTMLREKKMKHRPIVPMKAQAISVQAVAALRAMDSLPAPRYWPISVAAAMPIEKPGRKLKASTRIAMMCAPR